MSLTTVLGRGSETPAQVTPGSASVNASGVLCVNCNGCDRSPDFCEPRCMRCVCTALVREGMCDRIRLSAGRDQEISDDAADLFCSLAPVLAPEVSDPVDPRCRDCDRCPSAVMSMVSESFPEIPFLELRTMVRFTPGDDPECAPCLQRTTSMLNRAESLVTGVRTRVSDSGGASR